MKKMIATLAVAAAAVTSLAAVSIPTAADAQGYGYGHGREWNGQRNWHGPARGHGYNTWRQGYYGHYNRYPSRVCRVRYGRTVCYYR